MPPRTSARTPQVSLTLPFNALSGSSSSQTCSLLLSRCNDALWCFQLLAGLFGCWFSIFKQGHDAFIHRGVSQSWQLWYNLLLFTCVVSNPHTVISYTGQMWPCKLSLSRKSFMDILPEYWVYSSVCVCACVFVTNEDINLNDDRYYKVKVTYEDIASCPHFSKRL